MTHIIQVSNENEHIKMPRLRKNVNLWLSSHIFISVKCTLKFWSGFLLYSHIIPTSNQNVQKSDKILLATYFASNCIRYQSCFFDYNYHFSCASHYGNPLAFPSSCVNENQTKITDSHLMEKNFHTLMTMHKIYFLFLPDYPTLCSSAWLWVD